MLGRQASFTRLVGTHSRIRPYKGIRIHLFTYAFFLLCLSIFRALELKRPSPHFPPQPSPAMSGAGGKWMVSSVTEGHVKKLRKAGYLSKDIAHRLPEKGQLLPTPEPHFLRGLGFPLHPFVRGLMFYYGLDFHDLAPNFILNISAFIVVCEAFLRIRPHFGLWLKTFNVKPKVVRGSQAECGGAMAGKMANVLWLEGSFVETLKGWQSGWFYITEPRDPEWIAAPEFRSGPPMRLTSGPVMGRRGRGDRTTNMHPVPGEQATQACQYSPGYARPSDPPVPTTGLQSVGVRPDAAPNSE
ncbi:hypothetical protein ACQJBY_060148 [Aegilops geniculata]